VLAIVLCVIGYLLVCPRLELDRLKDFYLEKSEYQELRAREALTESTIFHGLLPSRVSFHSLEGWVEGCSGEDEVESFGVGH